MDIDIKENDIFNKDIDILKILLKDNTTKKNIIWATDNYEKLGHGFSFFDNISIEYITGENGTVIRPRVEKSKIESSKRTKQKAEVFTPSWICNAQNNLVDDEWFESKNNFNIEKNKTWETITKKIEFPTKSSKNWQDYITSTRLEITCGEAPYLVSRYDTVTGIAIPIGNRIGLLDRKLRVINENIDNKDNWIKWTKIAFQNIYGYDWQGDNVLLARENLFSSFEDYYFHKFHEYPTIEELKEIAHIISWNIWQMDGLKCVIPCSCKDVIEEQQDLFTTNTTKKECEGCKKKNIRKHNGIYCKIKDWQANEEIEFVSLIKEDLKA